MPVLIINCTIQISFVLSFLNIIDLLGILPFYVSLGLSLLNSRYSIEYMAKAAQIFRILRILRQALQCTEYGHLLNNICS